MLGTEALSSVSPTRVMRLLFDRMRDDPIRYRRDMLGVGSWEKQDEVALSVLHNKKTLVTAAHGVGKTHLTAGLVQWYYDCFEPSITLTTAPNWKSVVELLWAELSMQRRASPRLTCDELGAFWDGVPTRLRRNELHYATGHNAKTDAGFQGRHDENLFITLDEGPGVPPHIWKASNSMLQSDQTRMLVIGNPTVTSGDYYDAARDPSFHVIRMSALDHPNIRNEIIGLPPVFPKAVRLSWVMEMLEKHCMLVDKPDAHCFEFPPGSGLWYKPDDEFRSRVLGLFPLHAANAVWDEAVIEYAREHQQELPKDIIPELGNDVARFGNDNTTIYGRVGPCVLFGERHSGRDTMYTANALVEHAGKLGRQFGVEGKRIPIKVDDAGVGGGVTDILRDREMNVIPVNSANNAIDRERYPNRRSELWFVTMERAVDRRLDLTRLDNVTYNQLKKDLLVPMYKLDGHNRRIVEDKDQTKKRLGRSPDDADGFNLAFSAPIDTSAPLVAPLIAVGQSTWAVGS